MNTLLASPLAREAEKFRSLASSNFLPEVIEAIERHDDFEVAQAFLDLGAHAAEGLQALQVLAFHPPGNQLREHQHAGRGHQRGDTQPDIERQQEDGGAGHHENVAGKLHERLRKELIQLVGVVVDSRNQVAGLVLVEEDERQLLQLREQRIAQLEQDASADACPSRESGNSWRTGRTDRRPAESRQR